MTARGLPVALGIDLSTTAAKAVVLRADGRVLGRGRAAYPTAYRPGGIAEQDAADWPRAITAAARQALARSDAADRVGALAVATQSITVVPVDAAGSPLRAAISWLDTRAGAEAAELEAAFPDGALFRRTGRRPFAVYTLPKLRWLTRHEPDLAVAARRWLLPLPFAMRWLTGEAVTDPTVASGTTAFDPIAGRWDPDLLAWAGVGMETMPRVAASGAPAGELTAPAAEALGLPAGMPVVLGGQDQKVACFAVGLSAGRAAVSLGTAATVTAVRDAPVLDPAAGLPLSPHVEPDRWVLEGVVMTATSALDWLAATLGMPVGRLLRLAAVSPTGANGVCCQPRFGGAGSPDWSAGATATFTGMTLATTTGDLARAVIEGVAAEIACNLETLAALGSPADELIVSGGGTRDRLWLQTLADVTRRPVVAIRDAEVVATGAALLAGGGAGLWSAPALRAALWGKPARFLPGRTPGD